MWFSFSHAICVTGGKTDGLYMTTYMATLLQPPLFLNNFTRNAVRRTSTETHYK